MFTDPHRVPYGSWADNGVLANLEALADSQPLRLQTQPATSSSADRSGESFNIRSLRRRSFHVPRQLPVGLARHTVHKAQAELRPVQTAFPASDTVCIINTLESRAGVVQW